MLANPLFIQLNYRIHSKIIIFETFNINYNSFIVKTFFYYHFISKRRAYIYNIKMYAIVYDDISREKKNKLILSEILVGKSYLLVPTIIIN